MRKLILTTALAIACSMTAIAQEKLFMGANNQSPVVHDDGTVTFSIHASKAVKVEVTGDFLPAQTFEAPGYGKYEMPGVAQMKEDQSGNWTYTTDRLSPELYS